MIFVQKLPTLNPEMRDALRSHIIRKRQRLKQELEQDAIEKRLKREKELKQLQDAMTLDQIKEQLSVLEAKLQTLKDEKHNLFIQLKQVLNEDSTRQKQQDQSSDERKQSEGKNENHTQNTMGSGDVNNLTSPAQNLKQSDLSPFSSPLPKVDTNQIPQRRPTPIARHTPPKTNPFNPIRPNHTPYSINNNNSYLGPPSSHVSLTYPAKQGGSPRQNNSMNTKPMHPESHLPSPRAPLLSGPMQELIPPTPLNFGHQQRIQAPHLNNNNNNRPFLVDMQASFDTGLNHQGILKPVAGCKRSLSVANLNDPIDERSPVRKGSNNFIHSNPNQFILDSVPPHGIPNLSQYNPLNHPRSSLPINSIETQVRSSTSHLIHQNTNLIPRKQLSHQQLSNFDYMINNGKPGVMVPGLNLFYPPHPSLIPQTSLYPDFEGDLKHLTPPYYSLAQQYGNTSRPSNLPPLLPTENSSQYLTAASLAYNAARFPPHSKNHFSTNK